MNTSNGTNGHFQASPDTPNLNLIISRSGVGQKVQIGDPARVEKLIGELLASGPDELQVITDFDATLSAYHVNGKRCTTSYGALASSRFVPDDCQARVVAIYKKYFPYENDATISEEERTAKLAEWYEKKHANWLSSTIKMEPGDIAEVVSGADLILREGADQVLAKLHSSGVPTLVFSAGSGDSVKELLRQKRLDFPNTKVIANFMEFDGDGKLIAFSKPTIHPGNKNGTILRVLRDDPYFNKLEEEKRHNAILLGDNIGDVGMATGMPERKAILKIGYFNFNFEEQLETFKKVFDVVLVDDQTFHFVGALVDMMISRK